ncbi:MAG: hypothetical protein LBT46_00920 [Planctomycetaceae bacterium]|nr:hypothetical protein [Planctomycetaceae bacterium]
MTGSAQPQCLGNSVITGAADVFFPYPLPQNSILYHSRFENVESIFC